MSSEKYTHISFPQRFIPKAWPRWTILCLVLSRWQVRAMCVMLEYLINRPAIFMLQCHGALLGAFMRGYRLRGWPLNKKCPPQALIAAKIFGTCTSVKGDTQPHEQ